MQLAGKVTVITGSGSGFGEGTAKACAHEGASVVVSDINEEDQQARQYSPRRGPGSIRGIPYPGASVTRSIALAQS